MKSGMKPSKSKGKSEVFDITEVSESTYCGYIKSSYGNLRLFYLGSLSALKLVLMIHGSGSRSNGEWYCKRYFSKIRDLMISEKIDEEYLIVSVDCPGYGKSEGSKSIIRNYPCSFLQELIKSLGFKKGASVLVGNSQGAVSVFNAMIEDRRIASRLVQIKPLFPISNIRKLASIGSAPTLIIGDKDDPGHPIRTSKLICKSLGNCKLITYSGRKNKNWRIIHFPRILVDELKKI